MLLPLLVAMAQPASSAVPPTIIPLFEPSASGYPCFRQPALTAVAGGRVLLAWTEAYPINTPGPTGNCAPPLGANDLADIVYRRSTNAGRSWAPLQLAVGNNSRSTGKIDWYCSVSDDLAGKVFLFLQDFGSPTLVSQLISTDRGASFSAPRPLTIVGDKKGFALVTPSMGHGLQLHGGRLVAPFVCGEPEPAKATANLTKSCTLLSDNHGEVWFVGGLAQNGSAETALVQLPTGGSGGVASSGVTLFASMRNRGPSARDSLRLEARSTDGGTSSRRRDCHSAVLPSPFSRRFNRDKKGMSAAR